MLRRLWDRLANVIGYPTFEEVSSLNERILRQYHLLSQHQEERMGLIEENDKMTASVGVMHAEITRLAAANKTLRDTLKEVALTAVRCEQ